MDMNRFVLPIILIVGVLLVSGCIANQSTSSQTTKNPPSSDDQYDDMMNDSMGPNNMPNNMMDDPDVTFALTGQNFKFVMDGEDNPILTVKHGQKVRIEFTSTDGFHDWKVDEFNTATEKVQTDDSASVEFIADKTGEFEYYCSVGSHRAFGMKGKLLVEE